LAAEKALRESEARFRDLTELSSDWYWEQDPDYRFTSIAGISRDHLEHRRELALGKARWEVDSLEPEEGDWLQHKQVLERREAFRDLVIKYRTKTDEIGYMTISGKPVFDAAGNFKGYRGTGKDITEQKRRGELIEQRAMQQSLIAAFWQQALANIELNELFAGAVGILAQGLNVAFCKVLALASDDHSLILKAGIGWDEGWLGRLIDGPDGRAGIRDGRVPASRGPTTVDGVLRQARFAQSEFLEIHGIQSGIDVPIYGTECPYGVLGAHSREKRHFGSEELNFVSSIANILGAAVERKNSEEKLAYMAQFDSLTGLPNRNLLRDRLAQTLNLAQRKSWSAGVVFVDLDGFKNVNDTLGHDIGDKLLVQVAQRLRECVRSADTVARLGGDEFALVLSNLARQDDCRLVAQKVVDSLSRHFELEGHDICLSASLGIALYPDDGVTFDALLKNADTAMYRVKQLGRNGYQFYHPNMHERAAVRLRMNVPLRDAIERGE
jgi:diguanylate cyclase (GGDEF)-like protein/PAS domain S-box-containing protein